MEPTESTRKRPIVAAALIVALALIGAACTSGSQDGVAPAETTVAPAETTTVPGDVGGEAEGGEQELEPLDLRIGVHLEPPWHHILRHYDNENGILAEECRKRGYECDIEWAHVGFAPDVFAGMVGGDLQIGISATFPLINQWSEGQDYIPLTVGTAAWPFTLVVDPDSEVKSLEDLRGATIGAVLGTQLQSSVQQMLEMELGATVEELGIEFVNQPPAIDSIAPGMDAVSTSLGSVLGPIEEGRIAPLVFMSGAPGGGAITGSAYDGPLGTGEGIPIPSAADPDNPYSPEGFVALRHYWIVFPEFLEEHPGAVEAFVVAQQRMMGELNELSLNELQQYFDDDWFDSHQPVDLYMERAVGIDLVYQRGWVWPTETEIRALEAEWQQIVAFGTLDEAFDRQEIIGLWDRSREILRAAFEATGTPAQADEFEPMGGDGRGAPIWELQP